MNAAILNADLPMPVRMKRARRRGWRIDRPDNINYVVQGALAYRQLAAPLAWEGTFEQNRAQPAPFTGFGDESTALYMEAFVLDRELEALDDKSYPGIGNDKEKLQNAMEYLYRMSDLRNEESIMMGFGKGKLISVAEMAKQKELDGYEALPSKRDMTMANFSKEELVRLLAEGLDLTAGQVSHFAQTVPRLTPPPPPTRARTPRHQSPPRVRSPRSSPASATDGGSPESGAARPSGMGSIAEEYVSNEYGTMEGS
jgi:hypothetical protein